MPKGWISPAGKMHDLNQLSHAQFVKGCPKLFELTEQEVQKQDLQDSGLIYKALGKNWIRMAGFKPSRSTKSISVLKLHALTLDIMKAAEDYIFATLPDVKEILLEIGTNNPKHYEATVEQFRELGWEAFSKI